VNGTTPPTSRPGFRGSINLEWDPSLFQAFLGVLAEIDRFPVNRAHGCLAFTTGGGEEREHAAGGALPFSQLSIPRVQILGGR
jgi:hypothetical protein